MPSPNHLFFDLDHTLWDFDRASNETLSELFQQYSLNSYNDLKEEQFIDAFHEINYFFWDKYDRNKVTKDEIRTQRFPLLFQRLNVPIDAAPANIGDIYLDHCPLKPYLIEDALEILEYLKGHYQLHILTNGFEDVQHTKLRSANIFHYFNCIITSECTGHKKPSPEIFNYALQQAHTTTNDAIMIGDNLSTDILGAQRAGIPCIFFNPKHLAYDKSDDMTVIASLSELKNIF